MSQYVTRLRTLAKTCEFHNVEDEIIDQVIEKCNPNKLRKNLLRQTDLTLTKLLETAQLNETVSHQSKQYTPNHQTKYDSDPDEEVNRIAPRNRKYKSRINANPNQSSNFNNTQRSSSTAKESLLCFRCGSSDHLAHQCEITKGKSCHTCGKMGHFSNVCQSKNRNHEPASTTKFDQTKKSHQKLVNYIFADSSDDDFVLAIHHNKVPQISQSHLYPVKINGTSVPVLIDSGSTVNILSKDVYDKLSPLHIHQHHKNVYAFNTEEPLAVTGSVKVTVKTNSTSAEASFLLIPDANTNILGKDTAIILDLLRIGPPDSASTVNHISDMASSELEKQLSQHKNRCVGLGCLTDVNIKIHTDKTVTPIAQKARRLPILMQKELDSELDKLLDLGIIEPVTKPPTWVNQLVIVPKKDGEGIRICVDMRVANTAIIREPYQIPTLDEIIHTFNGCTKFTKLDLNKGYHQLLLDTDSRDLTAFVCHRGIFRYTRLIFGISPAAEIYQREIELVLSGIPGVCNISDDIIIGGKTAEELLNRQKLVLDRLEERNLTINLRKSKFLQDEILYMGHKISEDGIAPDSTKIDVINTLKAPNNIKELRSFLGMITYCSKFLPNFATITDPLRQLLKKDITWEWNQTHQDTFDNLKTLLLSSDTLAYFNPNAYTEIVTDASPVGLGAVITQRQLNSTYQLR